MSLISLFFPGFRGGAYYRNTSNTQPQAGSETPPSGTGQGTSSSTETSASTSGGQSGTSGTTTSGTTSGTSPGTSSASGSATGGSGVNAAAWFQQDLNTTGPDDAPKQAGLYRTAPWEPSGRGVSEGEILRLKRLTENMSGALTKLNEGPPPDGRYILKLFRAGDGQEVGIAATGPVDNVIAGEGNDDITVHAGLIDGVDAGSGNDTIAVKGGVVAGIHGGAGDDAITVNAAMGGSARRAGGTGLGAADQEQHFLRPDSVQDRMRLAMTAYSDVLGGEGNDEISVSVRESISVDGGAGDDVISVGSGTVGLRLGADAGDDVVRVGYGAELLIQIDEGDYRLETEGNDMIVRHAGGSLRIEGYEAASAIAIAGPDTVKRENARDDAQANGGPDGVRERAAATPPRALNMVHLASFRPLDITM